MTAPHEPLGRACRHFLAREALCGDGQCCAIGHPIRKIVMAANGGSNYGIAYMYPCRPGPERKADCPNYDPKTAAEIDADKARLRERMDRIVRAMPTLNNLRATMVSGRVARQTADCPFCGAQGRQDQADCLARRPATRSPRFHRCLGRGRPRRQAEGKACPRHAGKHLVCHAGQRPVRKLDAGDGRKNITAIMTRYKESMK